MSVSLSGFQSLLKREEELPLILRINHKLPHTRKLAGHTVAFSLEWHAVNDDSGAYRAACTDSEGSFGVVIEGKNDERVIGVAAKTPKAKGWVAAASIAASLYDNALIVIELDADQYWLLALCNGVPIPGKDWVGSFSEVSVIVNDLLIAFPFECFGTREFWSERPVVTDFKEMSLSDLLSDERLTQADRLSVYRNNAAPWIILAACVVVALAGLKLYGAEGVQWAQNTFTQQGERNRISALVQQVQSENAQYAQRFNQVASNYPLDHWIERLGSTLDQLRLTARGWNLTQLECGAGLPYCLATWTNSGKGTYAGLKHSIAYAGEFSVESPTLVRQSVPIERYQSFEFSEAEVLDLVHALPDKEQLLEKHFSLLQALTIIPSVSAGIEIKQTESVGYVLELPEDLPARRIEPFQIGTWELEGNGVRVLMGSLQKMDPRVFFGESLKITINANESGVVSTHWAVKGKYVAKIN